MQTSELSKHPLLIGLVGALVGVAGTYVVESRQERVTEQQRAITESAAELAKLDAILQTVLNIEHAPSKGFDNARDEFLKAYVPNDPLMPKMPKYLVDELGSLYVVLATSKEHNYKVDSTNVETILSVVGDHLRMLMFEQQEHLRVDN